ncbi:xylose isomerase [Luteimicrobium album]|uniref:Xylose isomerase n=1 Tax=Luteimicrobium album TaxID=1054550 RepID=A0ABQ6HYD4_9MICO|nr:sugar phosphate isomerase/epimerase [Luteimicrobium album]GMA23516.1 xylose isomerase [Luteimicrobium album]
MNHPPQLGVQLYSVRDHLGPELGRTLERLARLGYTHAEPYDIVSDPVALRSALDAAGLRATTAHAKITELGRDAVLPAAELLGVTTVVVPFVDRATFDERDRVLRLAERINSEVDPAAQRGIRLGYHNHDFELAASVDGRPAYELLVENLDERVVLELDTYWASVGGADVFDLLRRHGERIRLLHVKDEPLRPGETPARVDLTGRSQEVLALARTVTGLELPVVEIVVDDAQLWPALERNARFFRQALATEDAR